MISAKKSISCTMRRVQLIDIYRNLYPWKNLNQFVDQIKNTIAYKSEDNSLVALCKPFGVGVYTADDRNSSKQNQDKILYRLSGHSRYCIQDVLNPLSDELSPEKPYAVLKGIDRYMSGLVLLSNDLEKTKPIFKNALSTSRASKMPPYGLRAITSGYPTIKADKIYEKVGLELIEVDEFGDYKEPIIVQNPGRKFSNMVPDKTVFQAELEVKKLNKEYSTSLIELFVSKLRYDFPRCYISSKTSFVLGDVRFSKRIREVLGKPIQVSAFKSSHRYEDDYEPLNNKLQKLLGVRSNSSIPLMLDMHKIRLKNYYKKPNKDLIIESPFMPAHFAATASKLDLLTQ